uniref:Uncharacterized protein n=1 Tax=Anguilla anguilla TaxID=7936 RepID=A0A0E9QNF8_ANGAN
MFWSFKEGSWFCKLKCTRIFRCKLSRCDCKRVTMFEFQML